MTADERINALLERAGCPVMVVKDIEDAECLGYLLPTLRVIDTPMYGGSYGKFMKHLVDTVDRLEVALENALNERDLADDTVRNIVALDVAPVVRCKDCVLHGHCTVEDMLMLSGFTDGYCRAGKRVSNVVSAERMDGEADA